MLDQCLASLLGVEWLEGICKTTVPAPADRDEFLIHHRDKYPVNENLQHLATIGSPKPELGSFIPSAVNALLCPFHFFSTRPMKS